MPAEGIATGPHAAATTAEIRDYLREYYGRRLQTNQDFEGKACCTTDTSERHGHTMRLIPDEVTTRYFGCGCPIPEDDLSGLSVLDLGSGSGLDCFLIAKRVGPAGRVRGVDMTDEQLEIARRNTPAVMKAFGYPASNVTFDKGYIELCDTVADETVDLVVSDCVINLSPAKDQVFRTVHRVLKNGGELFFADIVADRRVPQSIRDDPKMVAECLGGALYEHDLFDALKEAGFTDPRVVRRSIAEIDAGGEPIVFSSVTLRAFKLGEPLDNRCEDYGQTATYKGTIPESPARFQFDDHHGFESGRPAAVCRNTARMLSETRLGRHFTVTPPLRHFGLFACGSPAGASRDRRETGGGCC